MNVVEYSLWVVQLQDNPWKKSWNLKLTGLDTFAHFVMEKEDIQIISILIIFITCKMRQKSAAIIINPIGYMNFQAFAPYSTIELLLCSWKHNLPNI